MGFEFNIVWLDDDWGHPLNNAKIQKSSNLISRHLEKKGFDCRIVKISDKSEVEKNINNKTSLFISDYNISSDFKGIDFMKIIRQKLLKQEVLLYTNGGIDEIKSELHKLLDTSEGLNILQRFSFSTTNLLDTELIKVIDLIISKAQELNILRGLYVAEAGIIEEKIHSLLESKLDCDIKKSLDCKVIQLILNKIQEDAGRGERYLRYCKLENRKSIMKVKDFLKNLNFDTKFNFLLEIYPDILEKSPNIDVKRREIHTLRNKLAHGLENIDENGNYYLKVKTTTIYEKDIEKYRIGLKEYTTMISKLLDQIEMQMDIDDPVAVKIEC